MTMRNVPLAERRADARALEDAIKAHRGGCLTCVPRVKCQELRDMSAELKKIRQEIRTWFAPGPDQMTLEEA